MTCSLMTLFVIPGEPALARRGSAITEYEPVMPDYVFAATTLTKITTTAIFRQEPPTSSTFVGRTGRIA